MKALVLSSGGVDSTICLALAVNKYGKDNVISLSLYYGQKHEKELISATRIAEYYGVQHIQEDISNIMKYAKDVCTLVKDGAAIPQQSYLEQMCINGEGRVSTYVPFRNGLLLSIAASYADSLFKENAVIYYGAHKDDAAGQAYADCSLEFATAMDKAIKLGTYDKVTIERPLINLTKKDVVKIGLELRVPYHLTWSCYEGRDKACGKCGICIERRNAFRENGVEDPIPYQDEEGDLNK